MVKELNSKNEIDSLIKLVEPNKRENIYFYSRLINNIIGQDIRVYQIENGLYALIYLDVSANILALHEYNREKLISFLSTFKRLKYVTAPLKYNEELPHLLNGFTAHETELLVVDKSTYIKRVPRDNDLRTLYTYEDYEAMYELYSSNRAEMDVIDGEDRELWIASMMDIDFPSAAVGLFKKRRMVSTAYAKANRETALIVGVLTAKAEEGKGYATAVVSELLDILLNDNLINSAYITYSTLRAKSVYKRLGFTEINNYLKLIRE